MIPSLGRPSEVGERAAIRRMRVGARFIYPQDGTVLDYGAGNGVTTDILRSHGYCALGYDVHEWPGGSGRGVVCRLPDDEFGGVFCSEVLEHCADDMAALLDIRKHIRRGAILYVTVPNKSWPFETHGCRLPGPWHRIPGVSWLPTSLHERVSRARVYTKRRLRRLLEGAGFRVLAMGYISASYDAGPRCLRGIAKNTIGRRDTTTIPFLATSIYAVAIKT